ncbi:hypothetical protein DM02DRAFT_664093 [Periconia macrospinosa]|uniref:Rhodopsin domain-containing protein n=1 Tax=Periconia macrospinosa TaxID=97972 RepID=A0A2V1CZZ5_9PLEO|nr:hypothetical protein DM02DRAFT_664093 [Periconia macrospinosa]
MNDDAEFPPGYLKQSRVPHILIGNITCQIFGSLVVLARVLSRLSVSHSWRFEDDVLVAAWVLGTVFSTLQYIQVALGSGYHIEAVNPANIPKQQVTIYVSQILIVITLPFTKLGICLTYLRIFYSEKQGRRLIKGVLVLLFISFFPNLIMVIFQCKPISAFWTERPPTPKCIDSRPSFFLNGVLNIVCDIALIAIVLPRVIHLRLNGRQKIAVIGIVMLGLLAVIAGIARMVRVGRVLSSRKIDPWDLYDVSIWTSTEINATLICAAAPGVKPLISKLFPRLLGTSYRSRTGTAPSDTIGSSTYRHRLSIVEQNESVSMTGLTEQGATRPAVYA